MFQSEALHIRQATLLDLAVLIEYNRAMALEVEGLDLPIDTLKAGLEAVLNDPARGFYRVAESAGRVVGQLMITFEWSDWRNGTFFWIQSVYVSPEARRRGIYRRLYEDILALAAASGDVCGVRLAVARGNTRAKATYEALGMGRSVYDLYEVDFAHGKNSSRAALTRRRVVRMSKLNRGSSRVSMAAFRRTTDDA